MRKGQDRFDPTAAAHPVRLVSRNVLRRALFAAVVCAAASYGPTGPDLAIAVTASAANPCAWTNVDWSEMPQEVQSEWETLGWTQAVWDSDDAKAKPASDSKAWAQLSASERDAATRLGLSQKTWDSSACESH